MANTGHPLRRTGRRILSMIVLAPVIVAAAWCALWFTLRAQAERNLDDWIAAEKRNGRLWTCAGRRFDGFPFGIGLTCDSPSFTDAGEKGFAGRLGSLRAEAGLSAAATAATVAVDLVGPLRIAQAGGSSSMVVTWSKAGVHLDGVEPGAFERARVDADGIVISSSGNADVTIGQARLGFAPQGSDGAELTLDASSVQDPGLNAVVGTADPASVSGAATISRLPQWGAALPALLEAWRAAGGTLDLTRIAMTKGAMGFSGSGEVRIDAGHRLEGRLDAQFAGLEPVAARFGIPVGAVQLGGLLNGLLGGKKPADGSGPKIGLPLIARDGHVFVGPVKTAFQLSPLY